MLRHLADFATSQHAVVHRLPFQWAEQEEKEYQASMVMLSQAPVVQPPDWTKSFHVFVDASDIAIGRVLMQLTESPNRSGTSVLCTSETLEDRAKLLHNRKGGSRDGV